MREVKIRKFSRNLKEELLDLPVMITRFGKPVAYVLDPNATPGSIRAYEMGIEAMGIQPIAEIDEPTTTVISVEKSEGIYSEEGPYSANLS
jgi:hypothetical protein